MEAWIFHFLEVEASRSNPCRKIEEARWAWHIGLDAESTAILNELWAGERGRAGPHAPHPRAVPRWSSTIRPRCARDIAGRSVYLALAADEDDVVQHEAAEPAAQPAAA